MSASNAFETSLLSLLFNNAGIANVGDGTGLPAAATAGSTQLALSTGTLGDTDTLMTASQVAYTGYARPVQARSAAGWTVAGNQATNAAAILFGNMTAGGPQTAHSLGLSFIATGDVLHLWAVLTADLIINPGVNPQFAIGAALWSID